ncbi:MAG TPA: hypothetical protein ENN33_02450 [Ignavibacteria bacterium]|nr:hypothetical protein [Ignavibacteria bacterium]
MVKGLDKFSEFFKEFSGNYLLIGGAACDKQLENAGLDFRATKDLDIVLAAEAYSADFIKKFWEFIDLGKYEIQEKSSGEKIYYRFKNPEDDSFPWQLELFSRSLEIKLDDNATLTPIPIDEDVTSLSAILMDDECYEFTIKHADEIDNVKIASVATLMCLKASAHLDLKKRKEEGENVDSKDVKKHRNDIIRLAVTLADEDINDLPEQLEKDLKEVIAGFKNDPPDIEAIGRDLGLKGINLDTIIEQMERTFHL